MVNKTVVSRLGVSFLIGLLLLGCFEFTSASQDADAGSDTDTDAVDADAGSDTDTDAVDTDAGSDTDTDAVDTDSCVDGKCPVCDTGPCCDETGQFKKLSESCAQKTEYRCIAATCGSNRQYHTVETFCSGTSADCDGKKKTAAWIPMSDCATNQVCELDNNGIAQCVTCGSLESCESGMCACAFETCSDICCAEEYACGWAGTCWFREIKLLPDDGAADDSFGYSVSVSGDVAIIGAYGDDDNGDTSGSAYIFERNASGNWIQKTKLLASDGAASDFFGSPVSVSGDVAIIGVSSDDDNGNSSGSAYIFERNVSGNWIQKTKLLASDGAASDKFGDSVSIDGDKAIIGAYGDDDNGDTSGSAYIFERNASGNWIQKTKLLPSDDDVADDFFGRSVSVSGDVAIIGAPWSDDKGEDSGSAYIFERNASGNWIQKTKLLPSDGDADDRFGDSVSVSGDVAIIGASRDDEDGNSSGSAYIFERNVSGNWIQKSKLLPSDGAGWNYFGSSVSVSGDMAIIGATGEDDNGNGSGSAYIFERNEDWVWIQKTKLLPSDGAASDSFGYSVSVSGDVAIIGAYGDDDKGDDSGSAYIF